MRLDLAPHPGISAELAGISAELAVRTRAPAPTDSAPRDHCAASRAVDVRVPILSPSDITTARQQGRALAARLGFSSSDMTLIATAISEVSRNIVTYAGDGEIWMTLVADGRRHGIRIVASDHGPGIPDVPAAMRDGYSTGRGLGIGLPGSRRLMDDFEIESTVGTGTTVTMTKWVARSADVG